MKVKGGNTELVAIKLKNSLNFLILFSKFVGVIPFYVKIFDRKCENLNKKTIFLSILQAGLSAYIIKENIYSCYKSLISYKKDVGLLINMFHRIRYFIIHVNIVLIYLGGHFQKLKYINLTEKLVETQTALYNINGHVNFKFMEKALYVCLTLWPLMTVGLYALDDFVFIKFENRDVGVTFIFQQLKEILLYVAYILFLSQYLVLIYLIKCQFFAINSTLKASYKAQKTFNILFSSNTPYIVAILRKEHMKIRILLEKVNETFAIFLICVLSETFCGLSIYSFQIYRLFDQPKVSLFNKLLAIRLAIRCFFRFIETLLPVYISEMAQREKNRTISILYELKLDQNEDKHLIDDFEEEIMVHGSEAVAVFGAFQLDHSIGLSVSVFLHGYIDVNY